MSSRKHLTCAIEIILLRRIYKEVVNYNNRLPFYFLRSLAEQVLCEYIIFNLRNYYLNWSCNNEFLAGCVNLHVDLHGLIWSRSLFSDNVDLHFCLLGKEKRLNSAISHW